MSYTGTMSLYRETLALRNSVVGMFLAVVVSTLYFVNFGSGIISYTSVGSIAALISLITSYTITYSGFLRSLANNLTWPARLATANSKILFASIFAFAATAPYAITILTIGIVADAAFDQKIDGAMISSVIVGVIVAILTYFAAHQSYVLDAEKISVIIAQLLVVGGISSALISGSTDWWYKHFSALGSSDNLSSLIFNSIIVFSGILLICLVPIVSHNIKIIRQIPKYTSHVHSSLVTIVLTLLFLSGVMALLSGSITYNVNFIVHDSAAKGIAICLGLMIAVVPWALSIFSRTFITASYGIFFILAWLWPPVTTGALKLSLYEIIASSLCLLWLIVFARHISSAQITPSRNNR